MRKLLTVLLIMTLLIVAAVLLIGIYGGSIHRWLMGSVTSIEGPVPDVSKSLSAESIKEFEEREAAMAVESVDEEQADP